MRKTVRKPFWAWNFDKEEAWLNKMATQGWALVAVGWCRYDFEETPEGAYEVRLELLDKLPRTAESQQYIRFLEESGAEYIGSSCRWVYFRKQKDEVGFDLYSDIAGRIRHLNRIITFLVCLLGAELMITVSNTMLLYHERSYAMWIPAGTLLIALLCALGVFKLVRKKRRLKKEQKLFA